MISALRRYRGATVVRALFAIPLLTSVLLAAEQVSHLGVPYTHRGVPYLPPENPQLTLDIFAPPKVEDRTDGEGHTIVIWVDDGWENADKRFRLKSLVDQGVIWISVNYRQQLEPPIEKMARNLATVIRWTRDHAKDYGGDPRNIVLGGNSAGAQLAALVCTNDAYLKAEELSRSIITGCAVVDGDTFDIPLRIAMEPAESKENLVKEFGDVQSQQELSPVTYVAKFKDKDQDKELPPFLILQSAQTPSIQAQGKRFYETLKQAGIAAKIVDTHGESVGTLTGPAKLIVGTGPAQLFGHLEGIIKPRLLETFEEKIEKGL
jgi:acetyl esterase/lipase